MPPNELHGSWVCCVCVPDDRSKRGNKIVPNDESTFECEFPGCSHERCDSCLPFPGDVLARIPQPTKTRNTAPPTATQTPAATPVTRAVPPRRLVGSTATSFQKQDNRNEAMEVEQDDSHPLLLPITPLALSTLAKYGLASSGPDSRSTAKENSADTTTSGRFPQNSSGSSFGIDNAVSSSEGAEKMSHVDEGPESGKQTERDDRLVPSQLKSDHSKGLADRTAGDTNEHWSTQSQAVPSLPTKIPVLPAISTTGTEEISKMSNNGPTEVEELASPNANNLTANYGHDKSIASSAIQPQSGFSTMLRNDISQDLRDSTSNLGRFEDILAARLKEFAVRFGNEDENEDHLRMMLYAHRHSRYDYSTMFARLFFEEQVCLAPIADTLHSARKIAAEVCQIRFNASIVDSGINSGEISLGSQRRSTEEEFQWAADSQQNQPLPLDEDALDILENEPILGDEALLNSEAYRWLVSMIQRTSQLDGIESDCMESHRGEMIQRMEMSRTEKIETDAYTSWPLFLQSPPLYAVRFDISWDLLTFLREEYDNEDLADVVSQVITLTGDGHFVQAQSCREYIEQVWPTTGSSFMDLIVELVKGTGKRCDCMLPDRTQISALLNDGACVIEAFGTKSGLCDVAEQVLWVSTALRRPVGLTEDMALCSAKLVETNDIPEYLPKTDMQMQTNYPRDIGIAFGFRVIHETRQPRGETAHVVGACWLQLFRFCPVVCGYPIPTRNPKMPGLEIPLRMMASLICAERVTPFGHDMIIKGYSDLLYATEHHDEYLMWHLICNKSTGDPEITRISFSDGRIPQPTDQRLTLLRPGDVLSLRHIVGWTNIVRSNAGAPDVEYNKIASSDLNPPPQGWALDRIQVTAGLYVTGAAGFVRGKKDKPIHRTQDDYILRLLDIRKTNFVLCDVDTRKVWLVNGLSTLLHLVRSHLAYAENDKLHQLILSIKASDLKAEGGRNGLEAAFETLRCDSNRMLKLHRRGGKVQKGNPEQANEDYYHLEDLVKSLLHCLEQIVDHQSDFRSEKASAGYLIKASPWERLEGFDFMDIASGRLRVSSRGMKLRHDGEGWVRLTRALEAPTLFGKHFGEMLEPAGADSDGTVCATCHWNDVMPPNRDLLAVQMEHLLDSGKGICGRLRFADGLYVDLPSSLFEPCPRDGFTPMCQDSDRIRKAQRATESVQAPPSLDARFKARFFSTEWLNMKWFWGQADERDIGTVPNSSAELAKAGAILLGMPGNHTEAESQGRSGLLGGFFRYPFQSRPSIQPQQVRFSPPLSNDTTANNSDSTSKTSRFQTEGTPLTTPSSSGLLPWNQRNPSSFSSTSSQPSNDDFHRRRRALQRQEQKTCLA